MALDLRGGNSILGLMGHIQQQGELGRQQGNQRGLAGLLSKGMAANPMEQRALLAKGFGIDPKGTQEVAGILKGQNEDLLDHFGKASVAYAQSGDPALARQWAQMGVQSGMLPPEALERDYTNPADIEGSKRAAQAFAQALANSGGMPAGLQEFQHMTQGLSPEDQEKARRIRLGLDGRASSAGYGFDTFAGPDGRERPYVTDPRTGAVLMYDEQAGGFLPVGGMGAPPRMPPAPQPGGGGDLVNSVQSIVAPLGGRITSTTGGQHNPGSAHPGGGAVDIGMAQESPQQQEQILAALRANPNLIVRDERTRPPGQQVWDGPHLHVERAQGGQGGMPMVGRRKEDETYATEIAKGTAVLQLSPAQAQAEADAARLKKEAEMQAERSAEAPKRIARYEQALVTAENVGQSISNAKKLASSTFATGFLGARARGFEGSDAYDLAAEVETIKANLGFDRLQQMRDNSPTGGALGQVAIQELIALQSTVANLDPNQSEEQLQQNLDRIEGHYGRWRAAVQQALAEERGGSRDSGGGSGRVITYDAQGNRVQ